MLKISEKTGLSFDDVLIVPNFSTVRSRSHVDLSVKLGNIQMDVPIMAANMDTVCEGAMVRAMDKMGAIGVVHRNLPLSDRFKVAAAASATRAAVAFGVNEDLDNVIYEAGVHGTQMLVLDIAHGHSEHALSAIQYLRRKIGLNVTLVGGNVATASGVIDLAEAGADVVKVGIGPGGACSTRIVTGVGVPQLIAIADCAAAADMYDVQIVADGGLRTTGDIAKALAAGADAVMLGSMLAGTTEAPGEIVKINGVEMKSYRGMASSEAGSEYPEGVAGYVEYKGDVAPLIDKIVRGVSSTCSYVGAANLAELPVNATFMKVSNSSLRESSPHDMMVS
jgi:IMP dehydrogenase